MERSAADFIKALSKAQLLNTVPSGLFLVDDRRHFVYWNPEAERITGYPAAEVLGRHCSILQGIECDMGCGLFDAGAPAKPLIGMECHIRTKSGKEIVILKNIDVLRTNDQVTGGIETFIDVTRQKTLQSRLHEQAEQLEEMVDRRTSALEFERRQLRKILNGMTDMAYIVTEDCRLDYVNRAMLDLLGRPVSQTCYAVLFNRDEPCADCPWDKVKKGGTFSEERVFPQIPDRVFEVIHTAVHSAGGDVQKLAVCRDITSRKETERQLRADNRQLDWFVQAVAHNLQSPLTPILGYAEYLLENYRQSLDEKASWSLREIKAQSLRLSSLIQDLLDLAHVREQGQPDSPVDANQVMAQVLLDNAEEIRERGIAIQLDDLPAVTMQESLLYQVLDNLVMNAVRYGSSAGGTIEVTGQAEDSSRTLCIRDHGPGIPPEEQARVFEMFYRGSTGKGCPGTGIGLATVKKILDLYGGSVAVSTTPGGGCTMTVVLPDSR